VKSNLSTLDGLGDSFGLVPLGGSFLSDLARVLSGGLHPRHFLGPRHFADRVSRGIPVSMSSHAPRNSRDAWSCYFLFLLYLYRYHFPFTRLTRQRGNDEALDYTTATAQKDQNCPSWSVNVFRNAHRACLDGNTGPMLSSNSKSVSITAQWNSPWSSTPSRVTSSFFINRSIRSCNAGSLFHASRTLFGKSRVLMALTRDCHRVTAHLCSFIRIFVRMHLDQATPHVWEYLFLLQLVRVHEVVYLRPVNRLD